MIIACLTPAYLLFDTYTSREKGGLPKWEKKEIFITIPMTKNLHSLQIDMKGSSKIKNGLLFFSSENKASRRAAIDARQRTSMN